MANILVVDDYPITQRVLRTQLRKHGHKATTASSGKDALEELAEATFDMVILDIAMPDMDGITVLRTIRAAPETVMLPVVMLTASSLDKDRVEAYAAGATAFLTKPISSWDLKEAVDKCLPQ